MTVKNKFVYLASKSDSLETEELVEAAKRLQIPLRLIRAESMKEADSVLLDGSILYWRSGKITESLGITKGRGVFLKQVMKAVPVINYSTAPVAKQVYKSEQQAILKRHAKAAKEVRTIDTFLAGDSVELKGLIKDGRLNYPFIAKPNFGRCGVGIVLVKDEQDLAKLNDLHTYVFQNFIPNDGDYRVLVIGGVAHMVFKRVATKNSKRQYLNNLSQGGERLGVTDSSMHQKLAKVGSIIAAMFGYTVCGVDILEGKDGGLYFLEVNSVPQWFGWHETTNRSVAEHVLKTLVSIASKGHSDPFHATEQYYLANLNYLPPGIRFHFLSRLYLWTKKHKYGDEIRVAREDWWKSMPAIVKTLESDGRIQPQLKEGGKSYRRGAHKAHPFLIPYNDFFFKCIFDRTIFSGTAFEAHLNQINQKRLKEARRSLLADPMSLFTLSTVAINFLYHYDYFLGNEDGLFDLRKLLRLPDSYKLENPADDLDARIYFYTHMIIGASRFYAEKISQQALPLYQEALGLVERLITDNYANCTIDHKAEFMVCARLCNYSSPLEPLIRSELTNSLSPHGAFFINTLNTHKGEVFKQTLETAEHSNVLALMAFLDQN